MTLRSNGKVKSMREAYELEVSRFKMDIEELERSKMEILNDLRSVMKEKRFKFRHCKFVKT
jgi:hypothetical protein